MEGICRDGQLKMMLGDLMNVVKYINLSLN